MDWLVVVVWLAVVVYGCVGVFDWLVWFAVCCCLGLWVVGDFGLGCWFVVL